MKLLDLPQFERFRGRTDVKVLRHKDSRYDFWKLVHEGEFERYQNGQGRDVFNRARYLLSFIAEGNRDAKFVGVWEVLSKRKKSNGFLYQTVGLSDPAFDELRERLVIRWGGGARSWIQCLHRAGNKDVAEIRPGNSMDFPGYYDFVLTYDQLQQVLRDPDANRDWYRMLSSVTGVYLITDGKTGKQYVGSAYGMGGIWARWKCYARSPSGENKRLKEFLKKRPLGHHSFQFSILRVLEPATTRAAVLKHEALMKKKLGSRAFGLNT